MGSKGSLLGPGSGRKRVKVDLDAAMDLIKRGERVPAIARELGVSEPTLRKRIAELSKSQGVLLKYREIQNLQLTSLQAQVLEAITPEKIEMAPLKDLVAAFKILKDKELVMGGKPSEIKGLVAHLVHMEKQEAALTGTGEFDESIIDAEYSDEDNGQEEDEELVYSTEADLAAALDELDDTEF
jgi:transposase-like protein